MSSKPIDLSCSKCGSNQIRFPHSDAELVQCEDCGQTGPSLHDLKSQVADRVSEPGPQAATADKPRGAGRGRRERHAAEVEASQADLRQNVAETDRLVGESDRMLRRHRRECDEDEAP